MWSLVYAHMCASSVNFYIVSRDSCNENISFPVNLSREGNICRSDIILFLYYCVWCQWFMVIHCFIKTSAAICNFSVSSFDSYLLGCKYIYIKYLPPTLLITDEIRNIRSESDFWSPTWSNKYYKYFYTKYLFWNIKFEIKIPFLFCLKHIKQLIRRY